MSYGESATVYYEYHKKHTLCGKVQKFLMVQQVVFKIQGGSNMTGTVYTWKQV